MNSFAELKLLPSLRETLAAEGLDTPTEIQARALPALLAGRSVVGVAETGSGKTLAYVLPILHLLKTLEEGGSQVASPSQPRAVVIVPARELGDQVTKVFKTFTHATRLRVRSVLGGTDLEVARRNVAGPFEVLVATPGRLLKLLDRGLIDLKDVRFLVFDEADQVLDQGFLPDAERIVAACPPKRQMALFSATVSAKVEALMKSLFAKAEVIRSQGSHKVVPTLTTQNREVTDGQRFPLLAALLARPVPGGTIVFTNTREQCDRLAEQLKTSGFECALYRGEMDKRERSANLKAFREGAASILVATDLASRGLDLERVGRIINYHLPQDRANYLHRVGRTARAGRPGLVINLVTPRDEALIKQLEAGKERKPARR